MWIVIVLILVMAAFLAYHGITAPDGYQNRTGFHFHTDADSTYQDEDEDSVY